MAKRKIVTACAHASGENYTSRGLVKVFCFFICMKKEVRSDSPPSTKSLQRFARYNSLTFTDAVLEHEKTLVVVFRFIDLI